MSLEISWLHEGHVILSKVTGILTLEAMQNADSTFVEMIRTKADTVPMVHILVDMREIEKMTAGVHEVSRVLTHLREPNMGWTLMVTDNRLIQFVGSMVVQVAKARFRTFTDFDEAYNFLLEQDQTVPPLENAS